MSDEGGILFEAHCPICNRDECEHSYDQQVEARRRQLAGLPPLVLADDPSMQATRRKKQESAGEQHLADLKWIMSTERGRRFLHHLLDRCQLGQISAVLAGFEPFKTMFHEGGRNVGMQYFAELQSLPEEYAQMLRENGAKK